MNNIYWVSVSKFDENICKGDRLEIAESLIDEKFTVTLLTGYRREKYYSNNYRLKIRYFKTIHAVGLFKLSLQLSILFWLFKHVSKNDIVMVPTGCLWMAAILKIIKKPKIHLDIRTLPVEVRGFKKRIGYFLYWSSSLKFFHRLPDSYSFITDLLKKSVEQELNIFFEDYVLWQSGVNVDRFEVVRDHPKIAKHTFVLTYLGVITRSRGIDLVMRALAEIRSEYQKKIIFQIIGEGPFLPVLKQMSFELGISDRVVFEGYVPYESVHNYLIDVDCFVCPLPERPEWRVSSPIKIFEYLACGKPVILTPIIAHKNIIKNERFIVWVDGDEVHDFTQAIEYAFENRTELSNLSHVAPDFVRDNYEWKTQGKKLSTYLKNKYGSYKNVI